MFRTALACCLALALGIVPIAARTPTGLAAFLAAYQCPVYEILETIHAHAMTPRNRFLVLAVDQGEHYVQCLFLDNDTRMLCEAASGFYGSGPRLELSKPARAAIAAQGFSMDGSAGNFQLRLPVAGSGDVWTAAGVMLATLYGGYGARLGHDVYMTAPFAPGDVVHPGDGSCRRPVS